MVIPSQTGGPASLPGGVLFPGLTARSHTLCVLVAPRFLLFAFSLVLGPWRGGGAGRDGPNQSVCPQRVSRAEGTPSPFILLCQL